MTTILLSNPPCKGPAKIFCQGSGEIKIGLRLPIGKSVKIAWGDGSTTSVQGTGINSQYPHTYVNNGAYLCYVCGDLAFVDIFIVTDVPHNFVRKVDISTVGGSVPFMDTISFFGTNVLAQIMMPLNVKRLKHFVIVPQSGYNNVLQYLNFNGIKELGVFDIRSCTALSNVDMLPSISITSIFLLQDTNMNKLFNFHLNVRPNTQIHYWNVSIPPCLSVINISKTIAGMYLNRFNYDNTVLKTANFDGNNPPLPGMYQAPPGYIQAGPSTAGNDGNPVTANQMKYVMEQQKNNFSNAFKYKWVVTTN